MRIPTNSEPEEILTFDKVVDRKRGLVDKGAGLSVVGRPIQSTNFREGSAGWRINSNGNAEFNNGTFRGSFNIGGTKITIGPEDDIQSYLDLLESEGGGSLFLRNGTYTLTADLNIPSAIILEGVSRDEVIIDCNNSFGVKIQGTNGYTTGTITSVDGDATITGVGTTWVAGMVGRSILVEGFWYEIASVTDTTHLELVDPFDGVGVSGATYAIANLVQTVNMNRVTIQNATGAGLTVKYALETFFDDIFITDCGTGADLDYCVYPKFVITASACGEGMNFFQTHGWTIDFSELSYNTNNGLTLNTAGSATFVDSVIFGNGAIGAKLTSCYATVFLSTTITDNVSHGVELVATNQDIQFLGVVSNTNGGDGYKLTATTDNTIISTSAAHGNTGNGVTIAAASCDNTILVGFIASGNAASVSDSGTGTLKSTAVNVIP